MCILRQRIILQNSILKKCNIHISNGLTFALDEKHTVTNSSSKYVHSNTLNEDWQWRLLLHTNFSTFPLHGSTYQTNSYRMNFKKRYGAELPACAEFASFPLINTRIVTYLFPITTELNSIINFLTSVCFRHL